MAKIRDVLILTLPAEWQGRGLVFGSASSGDGPPPPGGGGGGKPSTPSD